MFHHPTVHVLRFVASQYASLFSSDQALRIKTKKSATGATVSNITYSGNTGTGLKKFGVLIDQVGSSTSRPRHL